MFGKISLKNVLLNQMFPYLQIKDFPVKKMNEKNLQEDKRFSS